MYEPKFDDPKFGAEAQYAVAMLRLVLVWRTFVDPRMCPPRAFGIIMRGVPPSYPRIPSRMRMQSCHD